MINALIVDDEEPSRHKIRNLLLPHVDFIHTVAEAASGRQAIDLIHQHRPNLVFLDIHLMDMTGFDVLQAITVDSPYIIFTTAYDNYALRAFEVFSVEYRIRPTNYILPGSNFSKSESFVSGITSSVFLIHS